jgi:hypothetical protein
MTPNVDFSCTQCSVVIISIKVTSKTTNLNGAHKQLDEMALTLFWCHETNKQAYKINNNRRRKTHKKQAHRQATTHYWTSTRQISNHRFMMCLILQELCSLGITFYHRRKIDHLSNRALSSSHKQLCDRIFHSRY